MIDLTETTKPTPQQAYVTPAGEKIPFTRVLAEGNERVYVEEALNASGLTGEGSFTKRCEQWLQATLKAKRAMVVPSCSAALEMSGLMLDIGPGDEVIMPSFTYVTTANAYVMRGAVPVFVDIDPDTLNIDVREIEAAITPRTRAIVVVHYGGQACDMRQIQAIADRHGLSVIEDAAQGLLSTYRGHALGTVGRFGCISFHGTKNVSCGHGGALLVNRDEDLDRAEVVRDRGTDRRRFLEGGVQKYSWKDVGSSYFVCELTSAYLLAQLEQAHAFTEMRRAVCARYVEQLGPLAAAGQIKIPVASSEGTGNGHIFCVLTRDAETRTKLLAVLKANAVEASFHYTPLHETPAGQRFGRAQGALPTTREVSETILRLPVFAGMDDGQVTRVVDLVTQFYA